MKKKNNFASKQIRIEVFHPTLPFSVVDCLGMGQCLGTEQPANSFQSTHLGKPSPLTHCK